MAQVKLEEKSALVCAGGQGMGKAIALSFHTVH